MNPLGEGTRSQAPISQEESRAPGTPEGGAPHLSTHLGYHLQLAGDRSEGLMSALWDLGWGGRACASRQLEVHQTPRKSCVSGFDNPRVEFWS